MSITEFIKIPDFTQQGSHRAMTPTSLMSIRLYILYVFFMMNSPLFSKVDEANTMGKDLILTSEIYAFLSLQTDNRDREYAFCSKK